MKAMVLFGTRPEIIKLAPVIEQLERHPELVTTVVVSTGQHRDFTEQMTRFFDLEADYSLDLMRSRQTLAHVTGGVIEALDPIIEREKPDVFIVQGDTMSGTAGALGACLRGVRVAHVEAGLRTPSKFTPFPEEINRRVNGVLADWHFAPTVWARDNLVREGKDAASIHVTGNTGIDALHAILRRTADGVDALDLPMITPKEILVTSHRRENLNGGLDRICYAIREIVADHAEASVVFPVHWNPRVRERVFKTLDGHPRIRLIDPLPYAQFLQLMQRAYVVVTDSGGLQEEAPSLGKPVLVLRDVTERPEAVEAGVARLVGTDPLRILEELNALLQDSDAYREMSRGVGVFGDGHASERIVQTLLQDIEGIPAVAKTAHVVKQKGALPVYAVR